MNITIKKWGNSQGIIIPKPILSSLGVSVDDELNLEIKDDKIILSKASNQDDISDLILEDLIKLGFDGNDLLNEFKRIKKNLPMAAYKLKNDLIAEYKNGDTIDYEELFDE